MSIIISADVVFYAAQGLRAVTNTLNWRIVRGVGQLQILTRASYLLLILVPIMAATWPAIRLVVNQQNKAAREAVQLLRITRMEVEGAIDDARRDTKRLAAHGPKATSPSIAGRVDELFGRVNQSIDKIASIAERYAIDYADHTIRTPKLPWTLAAGFFTALFVALGHLLYQTMAPEAIRRSTWEEFIAARKEDYARHPSDLAIARANEFLQSREGKRLLTGEQSAAEHFYRGLVELPSPVLQQRLSTLPAHRLRSLVSWMRDPNRGIRHPNDELLMSLTSQVLGREEVAHSDMTLVDRGARAEYLVLARQRPLAIFGTAVLYLLGLYVISVIIKAQAIAVINAAEWHSVGDLLLH